MGSVKEKISTLKGLGLRRTLSGFFGFWISCHRVGAQRQPWDQAKKKYSTLKGLGLRRTLSGFLVSWIY
jgi:ribosomal protein L30/L7E